MPRRHAQSEQLQLTVSKQQAILGLSALRSQHWRRHTPIKPYIHRINHSKALARDNASSDDIQFTVSPQARFTATSPPLAAAASAGQLRQQAQVDPLQASHTPGSYEPFAHLQTRSSQTGKQQQPASTQQPHLPATPPATPDPKEKPWMHIVGLCASAALLCYLDRSNISTAIVPMANVYGWDKSYCGTVLSAFFAGYAATQILGGRLADKYGGKAVLGAGLAVWSLCTVLTPIAAAHSTASLLATRIVLGMAQGVAFPALHALLARTVPKTHRSGAIGLIMASAHCGTALAFGLSPVLIHVLGWQWAFYACGYASLLWLPAYLWTKAKASRRSETQTVVHQAGEQAQPRSDSARVFVPAAVVQQPGATAAVAAFGGTAQTSAAGSVQTWQNIHDLAPSGPLEIGMLDINSSKDSSISHSTPDVQAGSVGSMVSGSATVAATPSQNTIVIASGRVEGTSTNSAQLASTSNSSQAPRTGFWALLRRKEVWAIAVAQYTASWGSNGLLAWLPSFFTDKCGVQLSQLGGYTIAPYFLQAAVGGVSGIWADHLIRHRGWSVRRVRVFMQVSDRHMGHLIA